MVAFISHVAVDCRDPYALSEWWKDVLGYAEDPDDPNDPDHEECYIEDPKGKRVPLVFIKVPEGKTVKNRLHFDLRPKAGERNAEYQRLLRLGATKVEDHRGIDGPGTGWIVMADPEGNEFCILRSEAELG
ncbi:VOC family protein [Myceligenerans salitolerans]|uniref:VOC family protein n=1 Tax=Myceligenerans salitolerans TaxID=1230528 RepID=A0ABS3I532_9MICO|nr:VOC family protein [Myceligenerans salitolerans]MBO0608107.1 VOC family protein [Myceligenerans salitolerans]